MVYVPMLGLLHNPHGKRAMRSDHATPFEIVAQAAPRWCRSQAAELVLQFENGNSSQRTSAQQAGVPRSTLQHWLKRKKNRVRPWDGLRRLSRRVVSGGD